ncbi:MAG: Asp-tRNA(Asn)/Glu-tRNA(Gln) amidotransferase subunit GatB [Chitinophagaceae bacterium]|nr:MAG: Asp-tRNA(Asn)/Glu-tRNA(Gln) amidotransferase subunit GatB [Chitinophagaceae bacterium]
MQELSKYETVIGLEVHAQLLTHSKLFCGDSIAFGAEPNTHVSPITLAHPGTLPKMNRQAIRHAIKMGLACHCEIEKQNYFARKNYFYPDLPKGYQVSQHTTPICKGGYVPISTSAGDRNIQLNRIHMEEDAGKSLHDVDDANTCIDYNRAGTPLIEIVSEPDLHSAEETAAYLTELRKLVRYLGVCDGNMEEGSFRCDVNISVRLRGTEKLGTKVEIKNLNSIRNARKAVEYETERLSGMLDRGETILQQTRTLDVNTGKTFAIRDKEDADDYRYFADPDLPPFNLTDDFIESIRQGIPELQRERISRYMRDWNLPEYDAKVITEDIEMADYFEAVSAVTANRKAAANWMLGSIKSWMNDHNAALASFPLKPPMIAALISLVDEGKVSNSSATSKLFTHLLANPDDNPEEAAGRLGLIQQSAAGDLEPLIDQVLQQFEAKVAEYKKGKKGLLSLFVGEVMKRSKGKADPKVTNQLLLEKLK